MQKVIYNLFEMFWQKMPLMWRIRGVVERFRYRVDVIYRDEINDIPF